MVFTMQIFRKEQRSVSNRANSWKSFSELGSGIIGFRTLDSNILEDRDGTLRELLPRAGTDKPYELDNIVTQTLAEFEVRHRYRRQRAADREGCRIQFAPPTPRRRPADVRPKCVL